MEALEKLIRVLLSLIVGFFSFAYNYFFGSEEAEKAVAERLNVKKNIVVMGVDERSGDVGRSDTLFVVMLDTKTDKPALLSIPRDTLVKIKGHGWDKINHAYAYGGHKSTIDTVENFLGLKINNYVLVDFKGFMGLVDAIGGVDIDVEKDMYYSDPYDGNSGLVINLKKGMQHLDGKHAIQYARYRDEEGDLGRIQRQQKFMKAFYAKFFEPSTILNAPDIVKSFSSMVKTDLSIPDIITLVKALHDSSKAQEGIAMDMVPGKPADIEDINYWIPDMTELRTKMVQLQGANMSNTYWASAQRAKREYDMLLGTNTAKKAGNSKEVIKKPQSEELKAAVKTAKKLDNLDKKDGKNRNKLDEKRTDRTDSREKEKTKERNVTQNRRQQQDKKSPSPNDNINNKVGSNREEAKNNQSYGPVRVKVINCSGNGGALNMAVGQIQRAGIQVVARGTGDTIASTQIVAGSRDSRVIAKLSALSFRYSLKLSSGSTSGADAVIYIGKDFLGN